MQNWELTGMKTADQESCVQLTSDTSLATLVRSVGAIENANHALNGPLSDRLMTEIQKVVRTAAPKPWLVDQADGSVRVQHPAWGKGLTIIHNDAWWELVEISNDDQEHSWIAALTASGATRTGFQLVYREALAPRNMTTAESKPSADLGFEVLNGGETLFLPVTLEKEALADAYERDTFTDALKPVAAAVEKLIAAKTEVDRIMSLTLKRKR